MNTANGDLDIKKIHYIALPIRRIMKIAHACNVNIKVTNFLTDIFLIDASSMMPISVGRGEAIRTHAKITSKYILTESGIHR